MKKLLTLCAAACTAATAQAADVPLKIDLPEKFHVFYSNRITRTDAARLRFEDKELLLQDGSVIPAVTVKRQGEMLELKPTRPDPATDIAAAVTVIYTDKPGFVRVGAAADWWFDCYCNGAFVFANPASGNGFWPPKSEQYIFDLPLRSGRNEVVFYTRSGSGNWQLALGLHPEVSEVDKPQIPRPEPGIVYGPYLTNPSPHGISVNYVVKGRQPLELEYRQKGRKNWQKKQILIGGQLNDISPVMRFDLAGLQPDSEYEYRVLRRLPPEYRNSEAGSIYTFKTLSDQSSRQDFSFWVMGDTHLPKRKKLDRLQTLLKARPELSQADMFVHIGDFNSYLDNFQHEVFDSFLKLIPPEQKIVTLRGNHEFDGAEATHYLAYLGSQQNRSYRSFQAGNIFFIVLDTGHHLPKDSKNPYQRYTGLNELDTLLNEQKAWLKELVKSPEFLQAKHRIVLGHLAPHSHNDEFNYMLPRLHELVAECFKGNPAASPVQLWLAGHIHRYQAVSGNHEWQFPVVTLGGGGKKSFPGAAILVKVKNNDVIIEAIDTEGKTHDKYKLNGAQLQKLDQGSY